MSHRKKISKLFVKEKKFIKKKTFCYIYCQWLSLSQVKSENNSITSINYFFLFLYLKNNACSLFLNI
jgi:hypothetical protein